ncbi:hypothetical protein JYU16_01780 [bacterium AH-315-M05]|nr:hypothetical protein [bacterium AH-315-M05]
MACNSCSSKNGNLPTGCRNNGSCGINDGCNKLAVFDWLAQMELPEGQAPFDCLEVRFKNSTKGFYRNVNHLQLILGEPIAVEASPGHDIGTISLTGELVRLQMKKKNVNPNTDEIKKIYRKATTNDINKWKEVQELEKPTMLKARMIASDLKLNMKISDVEYQGDQTKAIFYFTADERVDFRDLIKKLASEFKVRVEMRQLGMRQEAGRLGGIGDCGRELCCSTWLTDFRTVSTSAARYQQLSLNPQKLAGQCGKLKCCLNYELDSYLDAIKGFPDTETKLETQKGTANYQKMDIFRGLMWYSYTEDPQTFFKIPADKVKEIIELNKQGRKAESLIELTTEETSSKKEILGFKNIVGQGSLTRFDEKR